MTELTAMNNQHTRDCMCQMCRARDPRKQVGVEELRPPARTPRVEREAD